MGLGMGVNRRVCLCVTGWVGGCEPACVCAYSTCMWVSEWGGCQAPQRAPMCCYQPLGLWDWQQSPQTKQFVHFLEAQWTSVSVRVHNQWLDWEMDGMGGFRYVHHRAVWNGQITGHCRFHIIQGHFILPSLASTFCSVYDVISSTVQSTLCSHEKAQCSSAGCVRFSALLPHAYLPVCVCTFVCWPVFSGCCVWLHDPADEKVGSSRWGEPGSPKC